MSIFLIIKRYFFLIIIFAFLALFTITNFLKIPNLKPSSISSSAVSPKTKPVPTPTPTPTPTPVPATPVNSCLKDGVCKINTTCTVSVAGVAKVNRIGECGFEPSDECYCEVYPIDGCDLANCSGKSCMAAIFGRPYDGTCNKNGDTCSCIPIPTSSD